MEENHGEQIGCYAKACRSSWVRSPLDYTLLSIAVGQWVAIFSPRRAAINRLSRTVRLFFFPRFLLLHSSVRFFRGEAKISRMKASCPSSLTGGAPGLSLTPCRADDRLHSEIRVAADKPFHSRKIELLRIGICAIRARQRARAKELSKLER